MIMIIEEMLREAEAAKKVKEHKEAVGGLDVNALVKGVMKELSCSPSKAFRVVGQRIGKSSSWVREHYTG